MGANPNKYKDPNSKRISPLSVAVAKGKFEITKYLVSKGCEVMPLMFYIACKYNNLQLITFILEMLKKRGLSDYIIENEIVNGQFENSKSTPLIRACCHGNFEVVKYLIEQLGASASPVNANDENCLMIAARQNNPEIVTYLCENCLFPIKDMDINYESKRNGLTAFARACMQQNFEIANILLTVGNADKNQKSQLLNKSILELAIDHKLVDTMEYLTSEDVDVNDSDL